MGISSRLQPFGTDETDETTGATQRIRIGFWLAVALVTGALCVALAARWRTVQTIEGWFWPVRRGPASALAVATASVAAVAVALLVERWVRSRATRFRLWIGTGLLAAVGVAFQLGLALSAGRRR